MNAIDAVATQLIAVGQWKADCAELGPRFVSGGVMVQLSWLGGALMTVCVTQNYVAAMVYPEDFDYFQETREAYEDWQSRKISWEDPEFGPLVAAQINRLADRRTWPADWMELELGDPEEDIYREADDLLPPRNHDDEWLATLDDEPAKDPFDEAGSEDEVIAPTWDQVV